MDTGIGVTLPIVLMTVSMTTSLIGHDENSGKNFLANSRHPSSAGGGGGGGDEEDDFVQKLRPCNFLLDSRKDVHITTPQIIKKYGYPLETHSVQTKDGYILQIHRIPAPGRPAVFLLHGIFSTSRTFVINCERRALAFKLAAENYDVWMGNLRGNKYTSHISLSDEDPKFWDFSQDEMALLDTPSMIDYVLDKSGHKVLSFVGMSMGNAVVMMMMSARPEYNDKINVWFAMGASIDFKRTKSPVIRMAARFPRLIEKILRRLNRGKFIPSPLFKIWNTSAPIFCGSKSQAKNYHGICSNYWFLLDGYDPGQVPPEMWSILLTEIPGQASAKCMVQWFQWIRSGELSFYDYGRWKNFIKYGTLRPPLYPVKNVRIPVVMFVTKNDWIATHGKMEQSMALWRSKNDKASLTLIPVNSSSWNHVDFIHGQSADILVYRHIVRGLKNIYDSQ